MFPGLTPRFFDIDIAAPGANTDIITGGITPSVGCALRFTVCLATAGVFNIMFQKTGGTQRAGGCQLSAALNAGDFYTFEIGASPQTIPNSGDRVAVTYNAQVETNGIIRYLLVEEAQLGTA